MRAEGIPRPDEHRLERRAVNAGRLKVSTGAPANLSFRSWSGDDLRLSCSLGFRDNHIPNEEEAALVRALAELAAFDITRDLETANLAGERAELIRAVIDQQKFVMHYQPIWDLETGRLVGLESLARFSPIPYRSPDRWFAEAAEIGLGGSLEVAATKVALSALGAFADDRYLSINASPTTILSEQFRSVVSEAMLRRIVLEITEHAIVENYDKLVEVLRPLRAAGIRIAIDDAGAGYASLLHIIQLRPDFIKLDMGLTRDIHLDPARWALASALVGFARETGSQIIAEGIETWPELTALKNLGVQQGQGFLIGHPVELGRVLQLHSSQFEPESRQTRPMLLP